MIKYPVIFKTHAVASAGIQTSWQAQAESFSQSVPVTIPPEFEGPGQGLSPEDLYAMALQNCFIATFKVFAEKSKLSYESVTVDTTLEVDRDEKGRPWMARALMKVSLKGASQQENAKRILEKTSQSCMILNSVNTQKTFEFVLTE